MKTALPVLLTRHEYPPIPLRSFDYCAWLADDEESGPQGWGPTEQAAIDALIQNVEEDDDEELAEQLRQSVEIHRLSPALFPDVPYYRRDLVFRLLALAVGTPLWDRLQRTAGAQ